MLIFNAIYTILMVISISIFFTDNPWYYQLAGSMCVIFLLMFFVRWNANIINESPEIIKVTRLSCFWALITTNLTYVPVIIYYPIIITYQIFK